jgi:uncharacterized protein (DUF952 family)
MFASADLALEGFIHCSEHHQILRTANKYFSDADTLTLLEIDGDALGATLVREDLTGSGMFPHVYAPIPADAVKATHLMCRDANGAWGLPEAVLSPK